jgi:hypothetical protein
MTGSRALIIILMSGAAACSLTSLQGYSSGNVESSDDDGGHPDTTSSSSGAQGGLDGSGAPSASLDGSSSESDSSRGGPIPDAEADVAVDAGGDDGATTPGQTKRIFVSSNTYSGNLGGLAGADAKCAAMASAASLSGIFKAWLSDHSSTAASRLTHANVPYVRTDGVVVAANWAGLTSGTLQNPISATETKTAPINPTYVWTNTDSNGAEHGQYNCYNWTDSGSASAYSGRFTETTGWSYSVQDVCSSQAHLYCIEQ